MALAECREDAARGETARIFAALREGLGIPLVNLIWRHLATLPGVLPWAWDAVRPVVESGALAGARARLGAALPLPAPPAISDADWVAAGLDVAARQPVRDLVAVYDIGNRSNLILLTALRRLLEDAPPLADLPPPPAPGRNAPPPPMPPPLPRLETLPPATAQAVLALAARHEGTDGVVPSLYLHLAHWPALPAALPGWLGDALAPATLATARDATVALALREADALRPSLRPAGGVPGGHHGPVLAVLGQFTGRVIPGMVPVGLALAGALDGQSATGG